MENYKKLYKDALEKAKSCLKDGTITNTAKSYIETIFPELQESEDEKIRNALLETFKNFGAEGTFWTETLQISKDKVVAWLEKQGEQILANSCKTCKDEPFDYECANIKQKDFAPGTVGYEEARLTPLERKVKDFLFDFHINATDGMSFDGTMAIVHNLITLCQQEHNPTDEEMKELLRTEYDKGRADAIAEIQGEQNHAWSEEDETVLNNLIYALANDRIGNDRDEYVSWLKSLRPQDRWKPSDEQIIALRQVISGCSYDIEPLVELETKLKEL